MTIERIKILFISDVNCNWSSVIRKKKTEGRWLVKRNLLANPKRHYAFYANFSVVEDLLQRYKDDAIEGTEL